MIADFLPTLASPPGGAALPRRRDASGADAATPQAAVGETLAWSRRLVRRIAAQRGPRMSAVGLCCKALVRETWLREVRRIRFRTTRNDEACAAYSAMTIEEFADINRRQAWANWRTIPRNLSGRLPARPIRAIDLCCGIGESTAVLACYAARGSQVLGLEYNARFVETARAGDYATLHGEPARVEFRAQSVLEDFCDAAGRRVPPASIDLVNASGAVGCHFAPADARRLAEECARVVRPQGLALVDTGRRGREGRDGIAATDLAKIFAAAGFHVVGGAVSCVLDQRRQLCLRRV